jgi:hypothetical protein
LRSEIDSDEDNDAEDLNPSPLRNIHNNIRSPAGPIQAIAAAIHQIITQLARADIGNEMITVFANRDVDHCYSLNCSKGKGTGIKDQAEKIRNDKSY